MRDGVLSVFSYRSYPGEQANDLGDMVDDGDDMSVVSGKELDHETMSVITENIFQLVEFSLKSWIDDRNQQDSVGSSRR